MEKQVLTIEQMKELESLGIDTSKASICWSRFINDPYYILQLMSKDSLTEKINDIDKLYSSCDYIIIPTFTLQDIINILPRTIEEDEIGRFDYELRVKKDEITYESFDAHDQYGDPFVLECYDIHNDCETLIDCAFEMLKWCKENKYI